MTTPVTLLQQAIGLATEVELSIKSPPTPLRRVAFGTIVRARRSAEAVGLLGEEYSYEAQVIVRSLLELYFNYAWIRLRNANSRASRFLKFHTLEKLTIMSDYPPEWKLGSYHSKVRQLEHDRAKLRHLFRRKDKNGRLYWAKSWAQVESLEARISQVQRASGASSEDRFMYALYRWFSSAAHGGPQSFADVLSVEKTRVRARMTAEMSNGRSMKSAASVLLVITAAAIADTSVSTDLAVRVRGVFEELKSIA